MNKRKFLSKLSDKLSNLPHSEAQERLNFYSEMIDDLIEEGLTEEQAVLKVGNADDIAREIVTDDSFNDIIEEKLEPKKNTTKGWQLALLILGSPIWFSLLVAFFAVAFSLVVTLFAVSISLIAVSFALAISLWAIFGSLIACAIASVIYCFILIFTGHALTGFAVLGAGLVCGGLSIFLYYGCKYFTKTITVLSKKIISLIKTLINKRRKA